MTSNHSLLLPATLAALPLAGLLGRPTALPAQAVTPVPAEQAVAAVAAGAVHDERGQPVPGALVRAGAATVRTDAAGRFVVSLPPGQRTALRATALGHAPAEVPVGPAAPGDTVRKTLVARRLAATLSTVQVTATPYARDPAAVAQSTTTVGAADLARTGGASLAASLAFQPGMAERSDGPGASAPIIRGLSGERVLVLHDGVRTGDLAATAADHGVTIDPLAARRVEVVRGPAALLHGSAATGGVVHVVSGDVPLERPTRAERQVAVQAEGALPGLGASLGWTLPLGDDPARGLTLRARAGARRHGDQRLGGASTARLANTRLDAQHGALGLAWAGAQGAAGVAYRGHDFGYGMPLVTPEDEPVRLAGARHELLAAGETRRAVGPFAGARAEASAQWYRHDELVRGTPAMTLGATSRLVQATARTRDFGPVRDGALGLLAVSRRNGVGGELALTPPTRGGTAGAYLFQEVMPFAPRGTDGAPAGWRALRIPVGVRWERTSVDAEASSRFGPARQRTFAGVSGAVGMTLPFAPGLSLGANLARAVRAPSAEELYSEAGHAGTGAFEVGDASLGTERTVGSDVVLRLARARLNAQVAAYHNRVGGWIGLYPTGRDTVAPDGAGGTKVLPLWRIAQRDARLVGAEASLEARVTGRLVLGGMADLVRGRDVRGTPLPFLPPARVGASVRWDDGRREAGARVRHALSQRRVPDGEAPTAAWTLLDLHAGWRLHAGGREHALTLRVDNATDALWRDAASRIKAFAPGMGRNVVVGGRTEF